MAKSRKRLNNGIKIHDGSLWLRLAQTIKVEEPISLDSLRRFTRDVALQDLLEMLGEMERAKAICVKREWTNKRCNEIFSYGR